MKIRAIILVLVSLLLVSVSLAEIPKLINYQGRVTDTEGAPVADGEYKITFRVYDSEDMQNLLWSAVLENVPVTNGLFNILVEAPAQAEEDFYNGHARYGTIDFEDQGEMPVFQFSAAPYAFQALHADTSEYALSGECNWQVTDSVLYTNNLWGIARGEAGNSVLGLLAYTHVNLGSQSTTGLFGGSTIYSTVSGGSENRAVHDYATVGGGDDNEASGIASTVSGGAHVIAEGKGSAIGGGGYHKARGMYSVVAGGGGEIQADSNAALGDYSAIGGGRGNIAEGHASIIAGGYQNKTVDEFTVVGGGESGRAEGRYASVLGGLENTAQGDYSITAGGDDNLTEGIAATISGGAHNIASGKGSVIGGGGYHKVRGEYSVIAGGGGELQADSNQIMGNYSAIGGGKSNSVGGHYSVITGGYSNNIQIGANFSYLFGIDSDLSQDSTFMVDMPHIWMGDETNGYELPIKDGTAGQVMVTNGSGQVNWADISGGSINATVGVVPVGSIISWVKTSADGLALPDNFVECNGQVLDDIRSIFNGKVIPNLNGDTESKNSITTASNAEEISVAGFDIVWIMRIK